jgi:sarcosine oxidase subunit beta
MSGTVDARILIIGAGAIGCATALALAARGATNVLVVDRGAAGSGSSSKAAGGLRAQFSTELNIRLTQLSQPFFREIADDIDWREDGYIFLARSAEQSETFRRNVELQRSLGVPSEWLSADEIEARWPWLNTEGVHAATWCPTDAVFDQVKLMDLLARRARERGVEIREGVDVRGLRVEDGRVTGVETSDGAIEAGTVVLAAGVWSPQIAATAGIDLPVSGMRRELFSYGPVPGLPDNMPFVADFDVGNYIRRDEQGFRVSGTLAAPDDPDAPTTAESAEAALTWATTLMPMLGAAQPTAGWAGLTEMTPDHHALLGPMPGVEGLIIATGFSGHGVMHAPAAGMLIAELLFDGAAHSMDIEPLSPARFAEGRPLTETMFARPHEQGDIAARGNRE